MSDRPAGVSLARRAEGQKQHGGDYHFHDAEVEHGIPAPRQHRPDGQRET